MKNLSAFTTLILISCLTLRSQNIPSRDRIVNRAHINVQTCGMVDFDKDGDLDFVTIEELGYYTEKSQLVVFENEPTRQFPKKVLINNGLSYPRHLIVADFDKDGREDFLVSMRQKGPSVGELSWFQNKGSGNFIKWTIASSSDFTMADTADFNKDGKLDIVAVGFDRKQVSVFQNQGSSFTEKVIKDSLNQTDIIKAGDLDHDGDIDFAFSDGNFYFYLAFNDGAGNFTHLKNIQKLNSLYDSYGFNGIEIKDVNADGYNDIITWDAYGYSDLYWLDGKNNWAENTIIDAFELYGVGGNIVVFDINKDGLQDIVSFDGINDQILAIYQQPSNTFQYKVIDHFYDGWLPGGQLATGDVDNDGDIDLLVSENGNLDLDLSWYENINGTLVKHTVSGQYTSPTMCKIGDINKDGNQDIVISCGEKVIQENEIIFQQNLGNGKFQDWIINDFIQNPLDIELGDMDEDGDLDVVVSASKESQLIILRNEGRNYLWKTDTIALNINKIRGIKLADLNKDNKLDILACAYGDSKLFWFLNNGNGTFSRNTIDASIVNPMDIETADFDGDGDTDVAVVAQNSSKFLAIYTNDGTGVFTNVKEFNSKTGYDIELGDPNKDGNTDIFISASEGLLYFPNKGSSVFNQMDTIDNSPRYEPVLKYTDINGDKEPDLILGYNGSSRSIWAYIYKNNKVSEKIYLARDFESSVTGIDAYDFDRDSFADIVYTDRYSDDLMISNYPCPYSPILNLGQDTFLVGDTMTMLLAPDSVGYSYLWSTGSGYSFIYVRQIGVYSLTLTDDYGCVSADTIEVKGTSGISNTSELTDFSVYPSPINGNIRVSFNKIDNGDLILHNIQGQLIRRVKVTNQTVVDLPINSNGLYLVTFESQESRITKKIVIDQ